MYARIRAGLFSLMLMSIVGCVPIQTGPTVHPNFSFDPPTAAKAAQTGLSIGILRPSSAYQTNGRGFFQANGPIFDTGAVVVDDMLTGIQTDIEKIIIAKGFTTAGIYPTIDEMTYGQKQRATLILRPVFSVSLNTERVPLGQSKATVSGFATLEFLEPLSREKVWVKRLELAPLTQNVDLAPGIVNGQTTFAITTNSMTSLLNAFYKPTMDKMWNQLDTQEIVGLKRDADKLKATTQYKGG